MICRNCFMLFGVHTRLLRVFQIQKKVDIEGSECFTFKNAGNSFHFSCWIQKKWNKLVIDHDFLAMSGCWQLQKLQVWRKMKK